MDLIEAKKMLEMEIPVDRLFFALSCKKLNKDRVSRIRICYSNNNGDALKFIDNGEILHDIAKTEEGKLFIKIQGDSRFVLNEDQADFPFSNHAFICDDTYLISPIINSPVLYSQREVDDKLNINKARTPDDLMLYKDGEAWTELEIYESMFTCVPDYVKGNIQEQYNNFEEEVDYFEGPTIKVTDLIDLQNNINEAIPKPTIYKIGTNQKENENEFNF